MKIKNEKVFLLTYHEHDVINGYLRWLYHNPIPCSNCQAKDLNKCEGYNDIFIGQLNDEENCPKMIEWFNESEEFRTLFENLQDEELRQQITNKYFLRLAESRKEQAMAEYLLAKNKFEKDTYEKVQKVHYRDFGEDNDDNLWVIDIDEPEEENNSTN